MPHRSALARAIAGPPIGDPVRAEAYRRTEDDPAMAERWLEQVTPLFANLNGPYRSRPDAILRGQFGGRRSLRECCANLNHLRRRQFGGRCTFTPHMALRVCSCPTAITTRRAPFLHTIRDVHCLIRKQHQMAPSRIGYPVDQVDPLAFSLNAGATVADVPNNLARLELMPRDLSVGFAMGVYYPPIHPSIDVAAAVRAVGGINTRAILRRQYGRLKLHRKSIPFGATLGAVSAAPELSAAKIIPSAAVRHD